MNNFAKRFAESRRLVILQMLQSVPSCEANEGDIAITLRDFHLGCSLDQVRIELAWLCDARLITIEELADLQIAKITQRGTETALGTIITPGVKRVFGAGA